MVPIAVQAYRRRHQVYAGSIAVVPPLWAESVGDDVSRREIKKKYSFWSPFRESHPMVNRIF